MPAKYILCFFLFLCACERSKIAVYRVPKEAPPISAPTVRWETPRAWTELPADGFRVASFSAGPAEISVVRLEGEAGGDLANVNRWRGQIGLGPLEAGGLSSHAARISPAGRPMLLVDFEERRSGKRLVAAIWRRSGDVWFFKMSGETAAVSKAKPDFMRFLESLKI